MKRVLFAVIGWVVCDMAIYGIEAANGLPHEPWFLDAVNALGWILAWVVLRVRGVA